MRIVPFLLGQLKIYLWDKCIQKICLGRYIVGYMVGNFVSEALKRNLLLVYIPPQMKILHMVIPILMHLFVKGTVFCTKRKLHQQRKTTTPINQSLIRRYIREYTDTKSWHYPIRHHVILASALKYLFYFHDS